VEEREREQKREEENGTVEKKKQIRPKTSELESHAAIKANMN